MRKRPPHLKRIHPLSGGDLYFLPINLPKKGKLFEGLLSGQWISFFTSRIRVNSALTLTHLRPRLYNFSTFISYALKMISPIGQSILKIRVLVGERRVLRLEQILQILGFNLIHPVGGTSVKIRGPA